MGIDHIDKEGIENGRSSITSWYVYMPSNVDRDVYIKNCFLTNSVTIVNDNGEMYNRVPIPSSILNEVLFPVDLDSTGSIVLCGTIPYNKKLYIIQVYNDNVTFTKGAENISVIEKSFGGKTVQLVMDAITGTIDLNVDSDSDGGEININVSNQSRTGSLNINVNGNVNVSNDGNIFIQSSKLISLTVDGGVQGDNVNTLSITKDKIQLNQSNDPMLLGTETVQLLSNLLDQLNKESAGPYPLLGQTIYANLKQNIDSLKSKLSFVK